MHALHEWLKVKQLKVPRIANQHNGTSVLTKVLAAFAIDHVKKQTKRINCGIRNSPEQKHLPETRSGSGWLAALKQPHAPHLKPRRRRSHYLQQDGEKAASRSHCTSARNADTPLLDAALPSRKHRRLMTLYVSCAEDYGSRAPSD